MLASVATKAETAPAGDASPTRLIVGLGNLGMLHEHDRANVGALAVASKGEGTTERVVACVVRHVSLGGLTVLAATAATDVDHWGPMAAELLRRYKIDSKHLIVLHEDAEHLELGLLRLRTRGPDGGHAGLRSIMQALRTPAITRVRIGVGRPGQVPRSLPSTFTADELARLPPIFEAVWDAVRLLARGDVGEAMSRYNRRDQTADGRTAAPHMLPDGRIRGEAPPRGFRRPRR